MSLNDLLADRESQPCAAGFALMFPHAVEFLKEMGNRFFRNAYTRILNVNRYIRLIKIGCDNYRAIWPVVFNGIA